LSGTLGQAAVIYTQELSGSEPRGVLRLGPDGAIYIAASATAESPGQILRLQADGTIPADNPDRSPLYSQVDLIPAGLAWQPGDQALWTAQTGESADRLAVLRRTRAVGAAPNDLGIVATVAASDLPAGTRASGLAIVSAETSPFYGSAIVSSVGLVDLLVFTGRERGANSGTTRLLQGSFGAIGGVGSTPAGDIYFFTANNEAWGSGRDVLVRLRTAQ
jgi:glucose/arabinose dehydrogenase